MERRIACWPPSPPCFQVTSPRLLRARCPFVSLLLLVSGIVWAAGVPAANAAPRDYADTSLQNYLSLDSQGGVPATSLIEHALSMPAVQLAMGHLASAGFQRYTTYDRAWSGADSSIVVLAFQSPAQPAAIAAVYVCTVNRAWGPETAVFAGGWVGDAESGQLTEPVGLDDCVSVVAMNLSETTPDNYALVRSPQKKFYYYVACVVAACGTCIQSSRGVCGPYAVLCAVLCCHYAVFHCAFEHFE